MIEASATVAIVQALKHMRVVVSKDNGVATSALCRMRCRDDITIGRESAGREQAGFRDQSLRQDGTLYV